MKIAYEPPIDKGESLVELAKRLHACVHEAAHQGKPLHEVERRVLDEVLRIGFTALEYFFACQGDGDLGATVTTASEQQLQRSAEPVERPLRTVFGEHRLQAYVYAPGPKKKIELRPIDARLALPPGRYSYLFEEFAQVFCVEQAFGPAHTAIKTVLHQDVPVDSLERLNRRVGAQAAEFLEDLPVPPTAKEGEVLVVTADGKGVPLVQEDAQRIPVFESVERPGNRRMATLGCVYTVDRHVRRPEQIVAALFRDEDNTQAKQRPRPQGKHLLGKFTWVAEEEGEEPLIVPGPIATLGWANAEITQRFQVGQSAIRLMDGQPSLWEAAEICLDAVAAEDWIDVIDVIHVSGYVWRAAKIFYTHQEQHEAFVRERLLRILQGETPGVIAGLRQMASKRGLKGKDRKEIETVCRYFENNLERMRYDVCLREGYPIATGVIEGACRHLVKDRLERSGMRWTLEGAQAMLDVRAVYQSDEWELFLRRRIEREQEELHPHRALLADYVPETLAT
jgi:hypothetical protein